MLKINWILSLTMVFAMSCSVVQAPHNAVPSRVKTRTEAFGAFIMLKNKLEGELIAVDQDSVYVLTFGSQFKSYYKPEITSARLIIHRNSANDYVGWGIGVSVINTILLSGAAETFVLEFITLVTGAATAGTESNKRINYIDYPQYDWKEISKFARFPQGLPVGLETNKLKNRVALIR